MVSLQIKKVGAIREFLLDFPPTFPTPYYPPISLIRVPIWVTHISLLNLSGNKSHMVKNVVKLALMF